MLQEGELLALRARFVGLLVGIDGDVLLEEGLADGGEVLESALDE